MTLLEIKQQAQNEEYKGLELTASDFRWAFKKGMKALNQLVTDGVFEVSGTTNDGRKIYKVI